MIAHTIEKLLARSALRGVAVVAVLCLLVVGLLQGSILVIVLAALGALLVFPI